MVLQSADVWKLDDITEFNGLNVSMLRRVHVERVERQPRCAQASADVAPAVASPEVEGDLRRERRELLAGDRAVWIGCKFAGGLVAVRSVEAPTDAKRDDVPAEEVVVGTDAQPGSPARCLERHETSGDGKLLTLAE